MARVNANPFTMLVPNQYKIREVMMLETLESRIDVQARSNPSRIASSSDFPKRNSYFRRSKIRILASTAMPMDNTNPVTPAIVMVTGMDLKIASTKTV